MNKTISRIGITPVGSPHYRLNRLRLHLLAYSVARKAQLKGDDVEFIIRCDDTNVANTNREFLDAYLRVLNSIGVTPNRTPYDKDKNGMSLFQSERTELYRASTDQLLSNDLAYEDSSGAIFFHTRNFSEKFRHILQMDTLIISDVAMGKIPINIRRANREEKGDKNDYMPFPLIRSNGDCLFNLCSPIDDAIMGITHVVRDRAKLDLLPQQEMVRIALNLQPFNYLHAPILVDSFGKRFVKDEDFEEATYQNVIKKGIASRALVSYLLSSLVGPSEQYYHSIDEFAESVNFKRLHQANTTFSKQVLESHQKNSLSRLSSDQYLISFMEFLEIHNIELLNIIKTDTNLALALVSMKRNFLEAHGIIKSLVLPEPEDLPEKLKVSTIRMIEFLQGIELEDMLQGESYEQILMVKWNDRARNIEVPKKEYFSILRYILTGQCQGCDLYQAIQYLDSSPGGMQQRVELMKQLLKDSNNLC